MHTAHYRFQIRHLAIVAAATISLSRMGAAADTGAAADQLYNRPGGVPKIESFENIQRVRIPITIQSWTTVTTKGRTGKNEDSRIAQKPIAHVLRARIEKPNDFYVADWRVQTTPIRWLKTTNQYQVKLELFRRFGESGQIEESLGSVNLTGILQKQGEGLFAIQGSARRRFTDHNGQPLVNLEVGTYNESEAPAPAVSKATSPNQTR